MPIRNDVAPYRLALKSNSSGTTTSLSYRLRKLFEIISKFPFRLSVFPIRIGFVTAYLSAKNRTRRLFFKFEFFREIRGDGIATVRPHLVANRESVTDGQNSSQSREARLNTKAFVTVTRASPVRDRLGAGGVLSPTGALVPIRKLFAICNAL